MTQVKNFVGWGRWAVAILLALQAGTFLLTAGPVVFALAFLGVDGLFYPAALTLAATSTLLISAWGLVKLRRWGYGLAMMLSILVVFWGMNLLRQSQTGVSGISLEIASLGFNFAGEWIFSMAISSVALLWLLAPNVRERYVGKAMPA